jgi:hypothetical protein
MIHIQKQKWKNETRILIVAIDTNSSVQISIPSYDSSISGKADALIYALFVGKNHRRCGVGNFLLHLAEKQAMFNGVKTIGLEFDKEESPDYILDWYLRRGYKPYTKDSCLLIKTLA